MTRTDLYFTWKETEAFSQITYNAPFLYFVHFTNSLLGDGSKHCNALGDYPWTHVVADQIFSLFC